MKKKLVKDQIDNESLNKMVDSIKVKYERSWKGNKKLKKSVDSFRENCRKSHTENKI